VARALIATEDSRFSSHHGLDSLGALRAATGSLSNHDQGGSTLDQQFAKVVYTPGQSGVGAKLTQAGVALKLDANYSKPQILEMYLSSVYFGHGYWGLPAAARGYFGRPPGQLDWAQASMLAGLVQAPSAYDPINHRALAKSRQRHVLDRLVAVHAISAADADTVFVSPLGLR
jgi:membrane peptidoglycan carboxypeptidase